MANQIDGFGVDVTGAGSAEGRLIDLASEVAGELPARPYFNFYAAGSILAAEEGERFPVVFEQSNAPTAAAGQAGTVEGVPFDCTLLFVSVYLREFGTDALTRAQVFNNDVSVHDSGAISIVNQQIYTAELALAFAAGNRWELGFTKTGTNAMMFPSGFCIFRRDAP